MEKLIPVVVFALIIFIIAALWKVFTKAGKPGWACIVPIYNLIVMLEIAGMPLWWILFFFIPILNFIAAIMIAMNIAKNFGKGGGFAVGLILLPFVFYPILGFGDAVYSPVVSE